MYLCISIQNPHLFILFHFKKKVNNININININTAWTLMSQKLSSHLFSPASRSWLLLCFWLEQGLMGYISATLLATGPISGKVKQSRVDSWTYIKSKKIYLRQRASCELTCQLCVCLWVGTLCVCAPGCHSWSSPPVLELARTGGPEEHSDHKTGSVSRLRGENI